jgi:hypothetical protein
VINVSAPSIVTAQDRADDCRSSCRDSTQSGISIEKSANRFPIVAFRNIEPFDLFPELDRHIVIADRKYSCLDVDPAGLINRHSFCFDAFLVFFAASRCVFLRRAARFRMLSLP